MQNDLDELNMIHTRAITAEVGERLRQVLGQPSRPSRSLQNLIDRLCELDLDSPPLAPE